MLPNKPPDRSVVPTSNGPTPQPPPDHAQGFENKAPLYTAMESSAVASVTGGEGDELGQAEESLGEKMLRLVQAAETSAETYANFTRKSWDRALKAFRNQHFDGSKYNSKEYLARTKHFRPKTRSAVRRFMAGTASSLFATVDAIAIGAGNEGDQTSRAGAALMQEVVNYRTDRTSGKNAIPWFKTAMGAAMDATLAGITVSKQSWKLETKEVGKRPVMQPHPDTGEEAEVWETLDDGAERQVFEPVIKTLFDRPDTVGIPPEQVLIDSGADWTDPAQSSAFLILKWPMKVQDIRQREKDPRDPWKHLSDSVLRQSTTAGNKGNQQSIRSSREGGTDRYDQINQGNEFQTIWVYEVFVKYDGEDYSFFSVGHNHLLTEPRPVDELYPWNDGERPVVIGYGSLEAHKIFPMAPAESWQQMQSEINDLANLTLDTVKMNIAPVAKIKRGRQVDLDKLRTRAPGTNLLMTDITDVEFEKPPGPDASAWQQMERLNNDFDTLAGQFDPGSVQSNRQLNDTVGGMRLISGAANTMQEFDQRVFLETWAEPVIGQIVRLCQYYEHDETILGLCGDRAQLWQKYGVNQITDKLIEAQITCRIDIGIGAGDPQQRLVKFQSATAILMPLFESHPKFISGEYEVDVEAAMSEVYGAAGYRDGGKRFLKINPPPPPPGPDPVQQAKLQQEQLKTQTLQAKSQADQQKIQGDMQLTQVKTSGAIQQMQADIRMKQMELALAERELALKEREMQMDERHAQLEAGLKERGMMVQAAASENQARLNQRTAEIAAQSKEHSAKIGMKVADHRAKQAMKPKPKPAARAAR